MKTEDIKIGGFYTRHDDALYKVLDIGSDWIVYLSYSFYHNVASATIDELDKFVSDNMEEADSDEADSVFSRLQFSEWDYLSIK